MHLILLGDLLFLCRQSCTLIGQLQSQRFQLGLLLLLRQGDDLVGRLREIHMFTVSSFEISNVNAKASHRPSGSISRLGGMKLRLSLTTKLLATFVADEGPSLLSGLQRLGAIVIVGGRLCDLFQILILILLKPFQRTLYCHPSSSESCLSKRWRAKW